MSGFSDRFSVADCSMRYQALSGACFRQIYAPLRTPPVLQTIDELLRSGHHSKILSVVACQKHLMGKKWQLRSVPS
jgi:hypothetical protein